MLESRAPAALFVQVCPFCCLTFAGEALAHCPDCRPTAIAPGLIDRRTAIGPPTIVRISNPGAALVPAWPKGSRR